MDKITAIKNFIDNDTDGILDDVKTLYQKTAMAIQDRDTLERLYENYCKLHHQNAPNLHASQNSPKIINKIVNHYVSKRNLVSLLTHELVGQIKNKNFDFCEYCGTLEHISNMHSASNGLICDNCIDDFILCEICERYEYHNNAVLTKDTQEYHCVRCAIDHLRHCNDCNNYFANDYNVNPTIYGTWLCEHCIDNNPDCLICYRCEDILLREDSYEIRGEGIYCQRCHRILARPHEPKKTKFANCTTCKELPKKIHTGLEIEAEYDGSDYDDYDYFARRVGEQMPSINVVSDGSLSYGMEFIIPATYGKQLRDTIFTLTGLLAENNFRAKSTCGLHVHLNAHDKSEKEVKKLIQTYALFEDDIFKMLPRSRYNNQYCIRYGRREDGYSIDDFDKDKELDVAYYKTENKERIYETKKQKHGINRYFALNVHSWYYRGSLEFRMHSGTTNATKIINWINILHNLYRYGFSTSYKNIDRIYHANADKKNEIFVNEVLADDKLINYYNQRVSKFIDFYDEDEE